MTSSAPTPSSTPSTLHFAQYYVDCLSQASYLVGDTASGRAVVVDPRRDVQEYLDDTAAAGLRIVGMVNTHFHADFLSGHLELAAATGAWIGFGRAAQAEFEIRPLADRERIVLGAVVLEIMETPGHTPESISVLVYEHARDEVPYGVLTGDTLFISDVGRPDLLASIGVTAEELGRQLYHSVQHTLMGLPDPVRLFPGHGAGSASGTVVLDARDPAPFGAGHLVGALNVPADGRFAETAGMVLTADQQVVVLAPAGREHEVAVRPTARSSSTAPAAGAPASPPACCGTPATPTSPTCSAASPPGTP